MPNRLAGEASPYLLQHQDNPVDWYPWGPEALARAQAEDKPILLSIGYAACHWCHVMAHESFENAEIARLMNANFVNIKVDREERPDLDSIYQHALSLLGEHGGWPLTMFLTPTREPFWGGTYFPPSARYGRPGFPDVLTGIARAYRAEPERIRANVDSLRESLGQIATAKGSDTLDPGLIDNVARMAIRHVDPIQGGTLGAPKFPQPTFFKLLWRAYERHRSEPFRAAVGVTLDRMAQGGIYDHLGGGFARYSTDDEWLVPHFEKMLYDNALLIDLLTEAWRGTRNPLYAARVRETVDWLRRDMAVSADGGGSAFASAFDADSEGEEGKYYVWTSAEIEAVLGAEAETFKRAYDVTPEGNWEGHTILNRSHAPALGDLEAETRLAAMRAKLLAVRARRVPPLRDDKVLADWNGLAIAALAQASLAFAEPAWLETARGAFRFVLDHMVRDGRLHHAWRAGRLSPARILDDHANMARAALALFEATGERAYVEHARAWLAAAESDFRDPAGGYFLSPADAADVIVRPKTIHDNATPAANGVLVEVMARLYWITGETAWRERAEAIVRTFGGEPPERLAHASSLIIGFETLLDCRQVVIVGPPDDPASRALRRAVDEAPPSNRIVVPLAPGAALPEGHPAAGKTMQGGRATAYMCRGSVCGLPIAAPEALVAALAER